MAGDDQLETAPGWRITDPLARSSTVSKECRGRAPRPSCSPRLAHQRRRPRAAVTTMVTSRGRLRRCSQPGSLWACSIRCGYRRACPETVRWFQVRPVSGAGQRVPGKRLCAALPTPTTSEQTARRARERPPDRRVRLTAALDHTAAPARSYPPYAPPADLARLDVGSQPSSAGRHRRSTTGTSRSTSRRSGPVVRQCGVLPADQRTARRCPA